MFKIQKYIFSYTIDLYRYNNRHFNSLGIAWITCWRIEFIFLNLNKIYICIATYETGALNIPVAVLYPYPTLEVIASKMIVSKAPILVKFRCPTVAVNPTAVVSGVTFTVNYSKQVCFHKYMRKLLHFSL